MTLCQALTTRKFRCDNKAKYDGYCHVHFTKHTQPTCSICLDAIERVSECKTTQCKHHFHAKCWGLLNENRTNFHCPMCRKEIPQDYLTNDELESCYLQITFVEPTTDAMVSCEKYTVRLHFTPEQRDIIHRRNIKYRPTFLLNQLVDVYKHYLPNIGWDASDWIKIRNQAKSHFVQMHYGQHHTNIFGVHQFPLTLIHRMLPKEHSVIELAENIESLIKKHLI